MNLREFINRLERLSDNGRNDHLEIGVNNTEDVCLPFAVSGVRIMQDPDYDFDTANCGPDEWIEITTFNNLCDYGDDE